MPFWLSWWVHSTSVITSANMPLVRTTIRQKDQGVGQLDGVRMAQKQWADLNAGPPCFGKKLTSKRKAGFLKLWMLMCQKWQTWVDFSAFYRSWWAVCVPHSLLLSGAYHKQSTKTSQERILPFSWTGTRAFASFNYYLGALWLQLQDIVYLFTGVGCLWSEVSVFLRVVGRGGGRGS